jgi:chromosomal replication initiator protein
MRNFPCLPTQYQIVKSNLAKPEFKETDPQEIIQKVCDYYDVAVEKLQIRSNRRIYVQPRQAIMYLLKKNTRLTFKKIGELFNRDHTTAIHACNTMQDLIDTDQKIRQQLQELSMLYYI